MQPDYPAALRSLASRTSTLAHDIAAGFEHDIDAELEDLEAGFTRLRPPRWSIYDIEQQAERCWLTDQDLRDIARVIEAWRN